MKAKEIREMTADELNAKLKELKDELFQHAINQLDNPNKIVECKRDIARVLTILQEKNA